MSHPLKFRPPKPIPIKFPYPGIIPPLTVARPDKCTICIRPPLPRSIYCPRCHNIATSTHREKLPRRLAAQRSYSESLDAFLDALFGVVLNLDDKHHPLYRNFVETFPGKPAVQLMTSSMGSMIKTELSTCPRNTSAFVRKLRPIPRRNPAKFPTSYMMSC